MTDNLPLEHGRSPLELLDEIPEATLRRLKGRSGRLATEAVQAMEKRLPFFADLEASQRASVQLVVQAAVVNFAEWVRNPASQVGYTAQAFELVAVQHHEAISVRSFFHSFWGGRYQSDSRLSR